MGKEKIDWITLLNIDIDKKRFLRIFRKELIQHPDLLPYILTIASGAAIDFETKCKTENDNTLRNALGDAVHLLAMDKKPSLKYMSKNYCQRIKKALYPNGISNYHHQGEKMFFKKMNWDKDEVT